MLRNLLRFGVGSNIFIYDLSKTNIHQNLQRALFRGQKWSHSKACPADDIPRSTNPFVTNPLEREVKSADCECSISSDEEKAKRLKVLQLEADIMYQEGRRVPKLSSIQEKDWDYILSLRSKSARMKYYSYLWLTEIKKLAHERKKSERAEAVVARKEELRKLREENNHIIYGLGHNSFFLRIYDSTINHWQNNRLSRAMQFSPKIVLDCSYDLHMTQREAKNAAKQLMLCFAENRAHDDPFDLHFCNINLKSICMQSLKSYIPTMLDADFPMNIHTQCFTELFPKQNLVYLTPHCRTDLVKYSSDDVYIIGAMVDTVNNEPLSLAKAKKLGLRMARLPLDRHLQWGSGSGKSLTLNQVTNIMLDLKFTGDWKEALRHVPRRKIINLDDENQWDQPRINKRARKLNIQINQLIGLTGEESIPRGEQKKTKNSITWHSNKANSFK